MDGTLMTPPPANKHDQWVGIMTTLLINEKSATTTVANDSEATQTSAQSAPMTESIQDIGYSQSQMSMNERLHDQQVTTQTIQGILYVLHAFLGAPVVQMGLQPHVLPEYMDISWKLQYV